MSEFQQKLEKYAQIIVRVGLNLREGQRLLIGRNGAPLDSAPLVREIAKAAYQAGSPYVVVHWADEGVQRIRVEHSRLEDMAHVPKWKIEEALDFANNGDALMSVAGNNPDLFNGLDSEKLNARTTANIEASAPLRIPIMTNEVNWLVAAAATPNWALKIFPDLPAEEANARVWELIFAAARVNYDDPVAEWKRHVAELYARREYMTNKQYTALVYKAPGTDLTVGLPENHIWMGGSSEAKNGISFVPNMPTEEVFTLAHNDRIDGVVRSTKPLSRNGVLMEDFELKFENGSVTGVSAKKGQSELEHILNTDDGARSIGEVALVPHSSPISQTGVLFYNTLFDENASNHLALGNAYRFCLQDGVEMSAEAFAAAGGNTSKTHVDFMMGSGEMDIDGIKADGSSEAVMRDGEWAFDA